MSNYPLGAKDDSNAPYNKKTNKVGYTYSISALESIEVDENLSENEINAIMAKLEVQNNENSDINAINIENIEEEKKENKITVEKITGKTYVRLCYANYRLYKS